MKLLDTEIRLEQYIDGKKDQGVALIIKIASFDYRNEAGSDPTSAPDLESDNNGQPGYATPVYVTHQIALGNVSFYMEEFRIGDPRADREATPVKEVSPAAEQFYSTMSELPDVQTSLADSSNVSAASDRASSYASSEDDEYASDSELDMHRTESLQIAKFQSVDAKIIVKQSVCIQGPKVQLELQLGAVNMFVTPRQLHALVSCTNTFVADETPVLLNDSLDSNGQETESNPDSGRVYNSMSGNLALNQRWLPEASVNECPSMGHATMDSNTIKDTSSMSNSITSLVTGYTQTTIRNRRRGIIEVDPNADILRTNIRIASVSITLLQEVIIKQTSLRFIDEFNYHVRHCNE